MAKFYKGQPGYKYWLGKTRSEETKKKISDSKKGIPNHKIRGKNNGMYGRVNFNNSGERHHNWKGGIGKLNNYFKRGENYKQWRKMCIERDDFSCQCCGVNGGKLEVHHILNYSDFPELRIITSNGITMCEKCHKKFHHKYGTKNNSKEQLDCFINSIELSLNK